MPTECLLSAASRVGEEGLDGAFLNSTVGAALQRVDVRDKEEVHRCRKEASKAWRNEVDPEVAEVGAQESRAEGAGGVEGRAGDGRDGEDDKNEGEANDHGGIAAGARLLVAGGFEDHEHDDEGADELSCRQELE